MDTVWNHCTDEEMNESPRDKTAKDALRQAEERDERERIEALIQWYDSIDRDALNEHFLSKGEWS